MSEIQRLIRSFGHAIRGISKAFLQEKNFQIHVNIGILVSIFSLWAEISWWKYVMILMMIGLVLAFELMNTAIESLCNLIKQEFDQWIQLSKDLSAGAVFIGAIIAVIVGITVLYQPLNIKVADLHSWLTEVHVPTAIQLAIMLCLWFLLFMVLIQWNQKFRHPFLIELGMFGLFYLCFFLSTIPTVQLITFILPLLIVIFSHRGITSFLGWFKVAISFYGVYLFYYLVQ